jgi:hypothetical protein
MDNVTTNNMKTYTLKEIKKAWSTAYNEDIKAEYKGFIILLKQLKKGHKK